MVLDMLINPENVCPMCGGPMEKNHDTTPHTNSKGCQHCRNKESTAATGRTGRPQTHTDENIIAWIESGAHTPDELLRLLELRSKSTLMIRLRRMRDAGLVTIREGKRCDGYKIGVPR